MARTRTGKTSSTQPHQDRGARSIAGHSWDAFVPLLAKPVSGASLALFRIGVGLVLCLEAWSLCHPSAITHGRSPLETYYTGPGVHFSFPYPGFDWLPLLPPVGMHLLIGILVTASLMLALGAAHRVASVLVFLTWGYLFALESTRTYWQSHYYAELLAAFLLIWMPAARRYSVDAWLRRRRPEPVTVPFWPVLLLRGQLVVMYFFGGISKLNADWLLDAAPLRWDLTKPGVAAHLQSILTSSQIGGLREFFGSVTMAQFLSVAGALFDLAIGPLLLCRRTRILGIALTWMFHSTNGLILYDNIDWFPVVGAVTTLIFLDPDWPERVGRWLKHPHVRRPDWGWLAVGGILLPGVGLLLGWKLSPTAASPVRNVQLGSLPRWVPAFVIGWLAFQAFMPVRHHLIPGDGRFTREGLSFSWRLKADNYASPGARIVLNDPALLPAAASQKPRFAWELWPGDAVLYREVTPGRIPWDTLPECVAILEPVVGLRMVYNPVSGKSATLAEAHQRASAIWQEVFGHPPKAVLRTLSLSQVLEVLAAVATEQHRTNDTVLLARVAARIKAGERGELSPSDQDTAVLSAQAVLRQVREGAGDPKILRILQALRPFALEGEPPSPAPFLVIDDPAIHSTAPDRIDPRAWNRLSRRSAPETSGSSPAPVEPMLILLHDPGIEAGRLLPETYALDTIDRPEEAPVIYWNALRDLSPSKYMHVSTQPFLLRRYALRVADLWQERTGRRPEVRASAVVSFNRRPFQALVDPTVDLASVPLVWFGHNRWIRDLEMARIPREELR